LIFYRRELEQRLRELKRRKKEKKMAKLKEVEAEHEKGKNRWNDFNSKVIFYQNHFPNTYFHVSFLVK
jgi:hypothetical protein